MEIISYALPSIYIANTNDFTGSFENFKKVFSSDRIKELSFFENFIEIYDGHFFKEIMIDINIFGMQEKAKTQIYETFKMLCSQGNYLETCDPYHRITIKSLHFHKFIIDLRNRYFHLKLGGGEKNIFSSEIYSPDYLFQIVNDVAINWISWIIFKTIDEEIIRSLQSSLITDKSKLA